LPGTVFSKTSITVTFVRISVLPDLELLVHSVPDEERLKWIGHYAENLRETLLAEFTPKETGIWNP
jgi:hypothetical protein